MDDDVIFDWKMKFSDEIIKFPLVISWLKLIHLFIEINKSIV